MDLWPSFQGVWDNLVSNFVWYFLVLVGTSLMAWWVKRAHQTRFHISPPFLVILAIGIYGLIMWAVNQTMTFSQRRAQTIAVETQPVTIATPDEETIRKWLDDFHLQVKKDEREDAYFAFVVELETKVSIKVVRLKKYEQFIVLMCSSAMDDESLRKINALPVPTREWIYDEVTMELLRHKVAYIGNFSQGIRVESRIPIAELTQARLVERMEDLDSAIGLIALKFRSFGL